MFDTYQALQALLVKRGPIPSPVPDSFDYFAAGLVDSLSALPFFIEVEDTFGMEVEEKDVPTLRTFGALRDYILEKTT